jgi:hypothetical protein
VQGFYLSLDRVLKNTSKCGVSALMQKAVRITVCVTLAALLLLLSPQSVWAQPQLIPHEDPVAAKDEFEAYNIVGAYLM